MRFYKGILLSYRFQCIAGYDVCVHLFVALYHNVLPPPPQVLTLTSGYWNWKPGCYSPALYVGVPGSIMSVTKAQDLGRFLWNDLSSENLSNAYRVLVEVNLKERYHW